MFKLVGLYMMLWNQLKTINDNITKLPENVTVPEESTKIHGITNDMMLNVVKI